MAPTIEQQLLLQTAHVAGDIIADIYKFLFGLALLAISMGRLLKIVISSGTIIVVIVIVPIVMITRCCGMKNILNALQVLNIFLGFVESSKTEYLNFEGI